MKKAFVLMACLSVFCVSMFAQQPELNSDDPFAEEDFYSQRTTEETIVPEYQQWEDKNASVKIVYQPMYDIAYIYYETLYVTYERGQANNAVIKTLEDFMLEKNYKHYSYIREDEEKYKKSDRGNKAIYVSQVKFTR